VLRAIAQAQPTTVEELAAVQGVGARRAERHGDDVLAVLAGRWEPAAE